MLFPTVDVCGNKDDRSWSVVLKPMRSRAKFSKYLTRPKFLRCPVVVVVGENPVEDIDNSRITPMTVEPDVAARRYGRASLIGGNSSYRF
jgi:hypothetical protein